LAKFKGGDRLYIYLSISIVALRPTRRETYVCNNGTQIGNIRKYGILFRAADRALISFTPYLSGYRHDPGLLEEPSGLSHCDT
jgi:hypothetical protein